MVYKSSVKGWRPKSAPNATVVYVSPTGATTGVSVGAGATAGEIIQASRAAGGTSEQQWAIAGNLASQEVAAKTSVSSTATAGEIIQASRAIGGTSEQQYAVAGSLAGQVAAQPKQTYSLLPKQSISSSWTNMQQPGYPYTIGSQTIRDIGINVGIEKIQPTKGKLDVGIFTTIGGLYSKWGEKLGFKKVQEFGENIKSTITATESYLEDSRSREKVRKVYGEEAAFSFEKSLFPFHLAEKYVTPKNIIIGGGTVATLYSGGIAFGALRTAFGAAGLSGALLTGATYSTYIPQTIGTYAIISKGGEYISGVSQKRVGELKPLMQTANLEQTRSRNWKQDIAYFALPSFENKAVTKRSIYEQSIALGNTPEQARKNVADALSLYKGYDVAYTSTLISGEAFANIEGGARATKFMWKGGFEGIKKALSSEAVKKSISYGFKTRAMPSALEGTSTVLTAIYGRYGNKLEWQPEIPFTDISIGPAIKFDYNFFPSYTTEKGKAFETKTYDITSEQFKQIQSRYAAGEMPKTNEIYNVKEINKQIQGNIELTTIKESQYKYSIDQPDRKVLRPGILLTGATGGVAGIVTGVGFAVFEGLGLIGSKNLLAAGKKRLSKGVRLGVEIAGQGADFPTEGIGDMTTFLYAPLSSGRVRTAGSSFSNIFTNAPKSNVNINVDLTRAEGKVKLASVTNIKQGGMERTDIKVAQFTLGGRGSATTSYSDVFTKTKAGAKTKTASNIFSNVPVKAKTDVSTEAFTEVIIRDNIPSISRVQSRSPITSFIKTKTDITNFIDTKTDIINYVNTKTDVSTNMNTKTDVYSDVFTNTNVITSGFWVPPIPDLGGGGGRGYGYGRRGRRVTQYLPSVASMEKVFRKSFGTATRKTRTLTGWEVRL